jgi:hypothetical protein
VIIGAAGYPGNVNCGIAPCAFLANDRVARGP